MLEELRETPVAEGEERVYFAGQKEFEFESETNKSGIPVIGKVFRELQSIGKDFGITAPEPLNNI